MSSRRARPPVGALVLVAGCLLAGWLLLVWVDAAPRGHVHTGDSENLVAGARRVATCVREGEWRACGWSPGTGVSEVFPYPALQYVPALAFVQLGVSDDRALELLARTSLLAFAAALALTALAARRIRPAGVGTLAVLAVVGGSATYQATAAFGEMLAATAALAAVTAALHRRTVALGVAVALACLGRETMLPFVLVLAAVCGRDPDDGWLPRAAILRSVLAGGAAGLAVTVGFNELRYGTGRNLQYLDPLFRVPGVARPVEFLAGVWAAPTAGIAWFWPVAAGVLALGTVAAAIAFRRARHDTRAWLPGVVVTGTVLAYTAGLATWVSPFGWLAYGPRLAVPLLPAATVAMLHATGPGIARLLRPALATTGRTAAVCAVVVLAGWAQFGAPWAYRDALADLLAADGTCPSIVEVPIQAGVDRYYECTSHVMWRTSPWTLASAFGDGGATATAGRVLLSAASVLLVLHTRRRLLAGPGAPAPRQVLGASSA